MTEAGRVLYVQQDGPRVQTTDGNFEYYGLSGPGIYRIHQLTMTPPPASPPPPVPPPAPSSSSPPSPPPKKIQ